MQVEAVISKKVRTQGKLKVGLTLFVLYHLYAVLLIPNSQNYLGLKSAPWVEPYVNFFEFVTAWGFFAPDPGPPPVFIDWVIEDSYGKLLDVGRWPDYPDSFFWRERQSFRVNIGRYMFTGEGRAEKMLTPYLCRQNEHAVSITLWKTYTNQIPLIDAVNQWSAHAGTAAEPNRQLLSHNFCKEFKD